MQLDWTTTRWYCCYMWSWGLFNKDAKQKKHKPSIAYMPSALFPIIETIKCALAHSLQAECFLCTQDMDPRWYVGQMSRGEAEVSLRQMNRVSFTT